MSDNASMIGSAIRRLSSALLRLTKEDLEKLVDPSFDVEIKLTRRRMKDEAGTEMSLDLAAIVEKLTAFPNREDALNFLCCNFSTKKPLEQIARHLDIPINKQDKAEALRDKIIEATTGARIRSEAIKGTE